jgi:hypothetical protein
MQIPFLQRFSLFKTNAYQKKFAPLKICSLKNCLRLAEHKRKLPKSIQGKGWQTKTGHKISQRYMTFFLLAIIYKDENKTWKRRE